MMKEKKEKRKIEREINTNWKSNIRDLSPIQLFFLFVLFFNQGQKGGISLIERGNLLFLDQATEDFDKEGGWAYLSNDSTKAEIFYQGIGKKEHLIFSVQYLDDRKEFEKKVSQYEQEKQRKKMEKEQKFLDGEITEDEYDKPIVIIEHFPEETFFAFKEETKK